VLVGIGVGVTGLPALLATAIAAVLVVLGGTALLVAFTAPGTWKAR
jgi:hypothetical protein